MDDFCIYSTPLVNFFHAYVLHEIAKSALTNNACNIFMHVVSGVIHGQVVNREPLHASRSYMVVMTIKSPSLCKSSGSILAMLVSTVTKLRWVPHHHFPPCMHHHAFRYGHCAHHVGDCIF